jgi:hypothetical protein
MKINIETARRNYNRVCGRNKIARWSKLQKTALREEIESSICATGRDSGEYEIPGSETISGHAEIISYSTATVFSVSNQKGIIHTIDLEE